MRFQRLNNLTGWAVWAVATVVYFLTVEPTASFWDCGEFIASAYKLEVGHPPGAPFFMLLGRLFMIPFSPESAALAANSLSVLSSSFTILFLFWTITHMAKRLLKQDEPTGGSAIAVLGAGAVGALAYTFSDSFWFSAVEGEVYALSSLFTALVFWAILKWERVADQPGSTKWIILIAYLMGLSIGVHLLNLLAIPAIAYVYYYRNYDFSWKGFFVTGALSLVLLGFVQVGLIQGAVQLAGSFELVFVNSFGMPFNTGGLVYLLLVAGGLSFLLYWSQKNGKWLLNTITLGMTMVLLGYSSFATIMIRSAANTPLDENDPQDVFSLLSYLSREQYGDRPLLSGQWWDTPPEINMLESRKTGRVEYEYEKGVPTWVKSYSVMKKGRSKPVKSFKEESMARQYIKEHPKAKLSLVEEYVDTGAKKKTKPVYDDEFTMLFPRMYSSSESHVREYKNWSVYDEGTLSRKKLKQKAKKAAADLQYAGTIEAFQKYQAAEARASMPTQAENFRFFKDYQLNWMYFRYFMWNFSGRQNDAQGHGNVRDGNWLSGVDFIDKERLGNRSMLTDSMKENKGWNRFYFLPLALGLLGLVFQFVRDPKGGSVIGFLFLLTGIAIVIYLNQYPLQPRERDYAYAGSFYAFAIWIGLGVMALFDACRARMTKPRLIALGIPLGIGLFMFGLENMADASHAMSFAVLFMGIVVALLFVLLMGLSNVTTSNTMKAVVSIGLAAGVPILMASEGWDDHDRSNRKTGLDMARNYLESLAPNAILFTNGDNDTFPLWYAQEVEGIRTDVRVCNLSLLNTDWYIDQMRRKVYESEPLPIMMTEEQYRQGTRDVVLLDPQGPLMDLKDAIDYSLVDENKSSEEEYYSLPTNQLRIPVDTNALREADWIGKDEAPYLLDAIEWEMPGSYIYKNHYAALNMIANNNWERPIYFAVTTGPDSYLGLERFFRLEGLAYRLVPIRPTSLYGSVGTDIMYENVMKKWDWGNMDDTEHGVYMDENNLRMVTNIRAQMARLAQVLIQKKKGKQALVILDTMLEKMPKENVPYGSVMAPVSTAYLALSAIPNLGLSEEERAYALETAEKLMSELTSERIQMMDYVGSLSEEFSGAILKEEVNRTYRTFATFRDGYKEWYPRLMSSTHWYEEEQKLIEASSTYKEYRAKMDKKEGRNPSL